MKKSNLTESQNRMVRMVKFLQKYMNAYSN